MSAFFAVVSVLGASVSVGALVLAIVQGRRLSEVHDRVTPGGAPLDEAMGEEEGWVQVRKCGACGHTDPRRCVIADCPLGLEP